MFDLGFAELMVIGIVALIVVGPKDLPVLFRKVGIFMGKARGMAREFSRAMNEAADESGVRDVAKSLKTATNPVGSAMDGVKDAARSMTKLDIEDDDGTSKPKKGAETQTLSKERLEAKRRMEASAARASAARKTREAEAANARAEELERQLAETAEADAAAETAQDQGPKA